MKVDIFNTTNKYQIIYADPPWEYKQSGSKKNSRGMAKQHYNTMTTDEICKLPISNIKTDNCILFMWATFPNIAEALKVMIVGETRYRKEYKMQKKQKEIKIEEEHIAKTPKMVERLSNMMNDKDNYMKQLLNRYSRKK